MAATPGKDYVIGKGRLFFDRFPTGTKTGSGELYFGNTPELSTSSDQQTLDHYDADAGLNVKDESVTIEDNMTGQFVTDNISPDNVNFFFGGDRAKTTVTAATGLTETFTDVKRGRWYQLGTGALTPSGVRNVTNVVVKIGAATVAPTNNYDVDLARGRFYIEEDSVGIADDADLILTYDTEAGTRDTIIGKGSEIRGALRFISANPVGTQKDYYWPYVKLVANGDFNLKGDEWLQIPFSFEVLKKDAATERVYIDNRTV
jgi:hypothetical protein